MGRVVEEEEVSQPLLSQQAQAAALSPKVGAKSGPHHHKYPKSLPEKSRGGGGGAPPYSAASESCGYTQSERPFGGPQSIYSAGVSSSAKPPLVHNNSIVSVSKLPFIMINNADSTSQNLQTQVKIGPINYYHYLLPLRSPISIKSQANYCRAYY